MTPKKLEKFIKKPVVLRSRAPEGFARRWVEAPWAVFRSLWLRDLKLPGAEFRAAFACSELHGLKGEKVSFMVFDFFQKANLCLSIQ